MRLSEDGLQHAIRCLIRDGENHRAAIFDDINRAFIRHTIDFFTKVAQAKRSGEDLDGAADWYADQLLESGRYGSADLAVHGGIPLKTIENLYESTRASVVLQASLNNYRMLQRTIEELLAAAGSRSNTLTINLAGADVELNFNESLAVINSLAVKREQIRAGMWASAGMQIETPLMVTLCLLHRVDERFWRLARPGEFPHQIDFVLQSHGRQYLCEVKLMGKGNPESAKAAHAHNASLLVGDRVSDQAKASLAKNNIEWVELAAPSGYQRFGAALDRFNIPYRAALDLEQLDGLIEQAVERTKRRA